MKIDIIIPTHNRAYCLKRAIDSVLNQTYQNFHLVVVDDASTDKTDKVVDEYGQISNISLIKLEENLGVSAARNKGIELTNSPWVAFLDSDDEWLPDKLEKQVMQIKENQRIPLFHGEEIWVRNNKRVNPKNIHRKSGGDIFERSLQLCLISPSAVIIKRELLKEMNGFDENFIVCEDYDLWLKITSKYNVGFIKTPIIIKYGGHEDQLSSKYFAMDYYRIKSIHQVIQKNDLPKVKEIKALQEIVKKSRILIKGYIKHQNLKNVKEIQNIQDWAINLLSHEEELVF